MSFLKGIFGKKEPPAPDSVKTSPLDPRSLTLGPGRRSRRHVAIGTAQSVGVERNHNEDALFVLLGNAEGLNGLLDFGLFVVADGMGGHRAGEIASALSVRTVAHRLTQATLLGLFSNPDSDGDTPPLQDLIRSALEEANQAVVERVPGGGTTLTAAVLVGGQVTIGHVGDSRAYLISDHRTRAITRDHSLVERLRELGQLTPEGAAAHPQRNVLYRAIGQGANLEVDVGTHPVPWGSYLLICSDGLWGVIPDEEIRDITLGASDPQIACEELIRAANAAGGPDNITAVLVHFPAE